MLFDFEGSDSPKVAKFLHGNSDVSAVLDVNPRAHERLEHIEDDDHGGVGRCRHRTAIDEIARHLSHRHQNGRRLKRDRRQQGDRHQEVTEEQDLPERVLAYYAEYYVHGISSISFCGSGDDTWLGRSRPLASPAPGSDKDEARGNRLSRSKIIREVVENLCAVLRV